uniref:Uncharacterized protein n=2 Tax=unclassified bacterial viruses TaxID=12333 RepID=A0AAU6VY20_9VIRU
MTTEQKLAHIQWYINQVDDSNNKATQRHYISMARGAAGAWLADMTITHEQFKEFEVILNDLVEETI